ncbi:MAG: O-antigen ligase family protein [Gemmatimonadaceae bacterium]|nr:O-antigen ligase family protein [Gemmatimonadaceae bacterium]
MTALPGEYGGTAVWVVLMMLGVIVFRLHETWPPLARLRPVLVAGGAGTIAVLVGTSIPALVAVVRSRIFALTLAFLGWGALTIPTSIWRGHSIEALQNLVFCTVVVGGILLVRPDEHHFARLRKGFLAFATLLAFALFIVGRGVGERYSVSYSLDPNDLAAVMAMSAPFALVTALRQGAGARVAAFAVFGLLCAAVVRTGSRGGTLALLVGLATLLLYLRMRTRVGLVMLAIPVLVAAWFGAPQSYRDKMSALARGEQDYNATEYGGRQNIWKRGLIYVRQDPLLGVGLGNFDTREGRYLEEQGRVGRWTAPHNAYLQAAVDNGVPGFLIFVSMLAAGFAAAHRIARRSDGAEPEYVGALAGFAVAAFFLSHAYAYHLYGLLGLIAARDRILAARGGARVSAPPPVVTGRRARRFAVPRRSGPGRLAPSFPR